MSADQPSGDDRYLQRTEAAQALYQQPAAGGVLDKYYKEGVLQPAAPPDPFAGAGREPFAKAQAEILGAPLTDEQIRIRPDDGNLYFPGVYYRRRLNEAFGMGGWALVPVGEPAVNKTSVYYTGRLYVLGRYTAQAMGKGTWIENNPKSDYGTALESARTDCLTRTCKDWIATELWDPDFSNGWRAAHCRFVRNPDPARFGRRAEIWLRNDDPSLLQGPVRAEHQPNVPDLSHSRETGAPIMGSWPQVVPDPSVDASREMDEEYRRAMGVPARSDLEVLLQRSIDENTIEVIDAKTGVVTQEAKATKAEIAKIHILMRELQLDEDRYHRGLKKYYGVDSSRLLTRAQAQDTILRLERWKAKGLPSETLRVVTDGETQG